MTTAKHRAIDELRRDKLLVGKHEELARDVASGQEERSADLEARIERDLDEENLGDDLLRLIFTACHPVLSPEARVAMTLRLLGRVDHRRDRARLPGSRAHHRATDRPRQEDPGRGARPLRGPARRRPRGAAGVGAGGHLPHLQRRVRGDRGRRLDAPRAVRGRAPPRPRAGGAGARRAGGARPRRADGDPGLARARPARADRRADPAAGARSLALGSAADPPRPRRRWSGQRRSAARAVPTRCRPRSPPATRARGPRATPTGRASSASTARSARSRRRRSSSSIAPSRWRCCSVPKPG